MSDTEEREAGEVAVYSQDLGRKWEKNGAADVAQMNAAAEIGLNMNEVEHMLSSHDIKSVTESIRLARTQSKGSGGGNSAPTSRKVSKSTETGGSDDIGKVSGLDEMGKDTEEFRNYEDSVRQDAVAMTYKKLRENQTVAHVRRCWEKYQKFEQTEMTIEEAITLLDQLVDDSDPDTSVPNSMHDFQTAERIRKCWPGEEYDWFHLVGLLHDVGKVLFFFGEDQWSVVGDTFPVGCKPSEKCVFPQFFKGNPDYGAVEPSSEQATYLTDNGIYTENCGFDNIMMSYGHDEYMYQFLKKNSSIPDEGLYIVRFHSFYPWHTEGAYSHLASQKDHDFLKWLKEFNRFDLYSKADDMPDVDAVFPYYRGLIKKYGLDGKLKW